MAALALCVSAYAQETKSQNGENPEFKSKSFSINEDTKVMELLDNVSFKYKDITIDNADKIVYNTETDEIIVSGEYTYSFKGEVIIRSGEEIHELRYKLGDDRLFIN